jgi:hypothetical protein
MHRVTAAFASRSLLATIFAIVAALVLAACNNGGSSSY